MVAIKERSNKFSDISLMCITYGTLVYLNDDIDKKQNPISLPYVESNTYIY